jgi:hypothetical protein
MPHKCSSKHGELTAKERLEEFWSRPSEYVQPKTTRSETEEMTEDKFMQSFSSFEMISGGRQVPNRKPKY